MGRFTITQFGNDTTPSLPDLDDNFSAFGVLAPIPCTVSGTNTLVFTQNGASVASSIDIAAYENYQAICAVAALTNLTAVTAAVGSLPALSVFKDTISGPAALAGGEIIAGNAFTLIYDSALSAGAGGWHLVSTTANVGSTITPSLVRASVGLQVGATTTPTLTGILAQTATLTYTSIVPGSSQDQSFSMTGLVATDALALGLPVPASTGISYQAYLGGGPTVTVRALNVTAASTVTPGPITVNIKALRTV